MAKTVIFTPEAEDDAYRGYSWYESKHIGLGREFITLIDACLQSISRNPKLYQVIYKDYCRAIVRRFPFSIIYEETNTTVTIYAILIVGKTRINGSNGYNKPPLLHSKGHQQRSRQAGGGMAADFACSRSKLAKHGVPADAPRVLPPSSGQPAGDR